MHFQRVDEIIIKHKKKDLQYFCECGFEISINNDTIHYQQSATCHSFYLSWKYVGKLLLHLFAIPFVIEPADVAHYYTSYSLR